MRVHVELYREESATVTIDTADYPDETAGWDALDEPALRDAASAAAWEVVEPYEWNDEDHGENAVRIER